MAERVGFRWESSGQIGILKTEIPTIARALELYSKMQRRDILADTTIRKRRELLQGKLLPFCNGKGISLLKQLDVPTLRSF